MKTKITIIRDIIRCLCGFATNTVSFYLSTSSSEPKPTVTYKKGDRKIFAPLVMLNHNYCDHVIVNSMHILAYDAITMPARGTHMAWHILCERLFYDSATRSLSNFYIRTVVSFSTITIFVPDIIPFSNFILLPVFISCFSFHV